MMCNVYIEFHTCIGLCILVYPGSMGVTPTEIAGSEMMVGAPPAGW